MPRRQRLKTTLRAAFLSSAFFAMDLDGVLRAQAPTPATPPVVRPALPETDVEAQPQGTPGTASADTQVQPFANADQFPPPSIVNSNAFLAAPVTGYLAPSSTAGTLVDTPNLLFPGTIGTVTPDLIKDQQILSFAEAMRNIGGATANSGDGIVGDKIFIRGQELTTYAYRKDGFFDPSYIPRDFSNIERIDVLKGPASVMYGGGDSAGMVNVVTKRALANQSFQNFYYTFGSYEQSRYGVDMNGNVNESGNLLYRINAVHEESNSFRDFGYVNRTMIAPAFTWVIDDDTTVSWNSEYHTDTRRGDTGIPAINGNVFAVPYKTYMGQPAVDQIQYTDYRTELMFNKKYSDNWSGYAGIQGQWYGFPGTQTSAEIYNGGTSFYQGQQTFSDRESSTSFIANLAGNEDIGNTNHKMVYGFEQVYYESQSIFNESTLATPINAANPMYTSPPYATIPGYSSTASFPAFNQVRSGFYANDLIKLSDNWYVMAGCRLDRLNVLYNRDEGAGLQSTDQDFYYAAPRGGLVYQPIPDVVSLYYTYNRSFQPPNPAGGFPFNNVILPVLGEMHEVGIKTQLNDKCQLTVAGFHTVQDNVNFTDFFTAGGPTFFLYNNRSQGADVNLIGQVTDNLSVTANYVYTDSKLTGGTVPADIHGQSALNVPLNTANFWARYNLIQSQQETVGVALGWTHLGKRSADIQDDLTLPAYSTWNTGAYYKKGKFYCNFDLYNIFNIRYIASSIDDLHLMPGAPITARCTMGYVF